MTAHRIEAPISQPEPYHYTATVVGPARGYQRARHAGRRHWHTPEHVAYAATWEQVGRMASAYLGMLDLATLEVTVYHRARRKCDRGVEVLGKPDLDNVGKIIMDGITASGLWPDDTRVVRLVVRRIGCAPGEERVQARIGQVRRHTGREVTCYDEAAERAAREG